MRGSGGWSAKITVGSAEGMASIAAAWERPALRQDAPASNAREIVFNIDVLCTISSYSAGRRLLDLTNKNQNRVGLVNRNGISIHHVGVSARFYPLAFIFDERGARMVNRWCVRQRAGSAGFFA
jgi:hypothetical protein